jgi:hypothetical protein
MDELKNTGEKVQLARVLCCYGTNCNLVISEKNIEGKEKRRDERVT